VAKRATALPGTAKNVTIGGKPARENLGIFQQYLEGRLSAEQREAERKRALAKIGELLQCDVLSYAAYMAQLPVKVPLGVVYEDQLPFVDMLTPLKSKRIALILETPGGVGEVGREMVEILHERFEHVIMIVPGTAKSTGTIMALGGHEILMGPGSSLGPIDAQITQEGRTYSADALLEGLERIQKEIEGPPEKPLSPAYIPFLQKLSPGEIEQAYNAREFARVTVTDWLCKYKFADWDRTETRQIKVTDDMKRARAYQISKDLSSQGKWHTHGRSIRIPDLKDLNLKIRDYSAEPELYDAIQRDHVLLRMTFLSGNGYKIFETTMATIMRRYPATPSAGIKAAESVLIESTCQNCKTQSKVQLDFAKGVSLDSGAAPFPESGILACPTCGHPIDFRAARANVEAQVGRKGIIPKADQSPGIKQ
jgi:hypothetical protein